MYNSKNKQRKNDDDFTSTTKWLTLKYLSNS